MMYRDEDGKLRGPNSIEEYQKELDQEKNWQATIEEADFFGPNNCWLKEMLIVSLVGSFILIFGIKFLGSDFYNIQFVYIGASLFNWFMCHIVMFFIIFFALVMYNGKRVTELKANARASVYRTREIIILLEKIKKMESS